MHKRVFLALMCLVAVIAGLTAGAAEKRAPVKVALTFDDAIKDHLLIAAPMLEARGWRGTFCIVIDYIGKDKMYLTWDDVRELLRRGHEVTNHTKSHRRLADLANANPAELRSEIALARDIIADKTGFTPRFLCLPYGSRNAMTDKVALEEGQRTMRVRRRNFGEGNHDKVREYIEQLYDAGVVSADLLHHGISKVDNGGWCAFKDAQEFAAHLDTIATLEREGKLIVTDYDGIASNVKLKARAWPRHGVVALSFDDRNFADWRKVLPILKRHGACATFFASGQIGQDEIDFARRAIASGNEFGLHGLSHLNADTALANMGAAEYWQKEIEPQLTPLKAAGIYVRSFAYPNCRRDEATDALFFSHGFTRLRGSVKGKPTPNPYDPQGLKRDSWRAVASDDASYVPAAQYLTNKLIGNVILGEDYHTDINDILKAIERAGANAEAISLVSHGIHRKAKKIHMKSEWLKEILAAASDAGVIVRGVR